jgi:hypothetical protein
MEYVVQILLERNPRGNVCENTAQTLQPVLAHIQEAKYELDVSTLRVLYLYAQSTFTYFCRLVSFLRHILKRIDEIHYELISSVCHLLLEYELEQVEAQS